MSTKALKSSLTPASRERLLRDDRWLRDHYREVLHQHLGCWVAVYGEQVVAASATVREVDAHLRRLGIEQDAILAFMEPDAPHLGTA